MVINPLAVAFCLFLGNAMAWNVGCTFSAFSTSSFSRVGEVCKPQCMQSSKRYKQDRCLGLKVRASAEDSYDEVVKLFNPPVQTNGGSQENILELGLFPMIIDDKYIDGSVLIPGGKMPLNIFAMKFRSLFSKTYDGQEKAGMIYFDGPTKQYAAVGTVIEIEQYRGMPDGRIAVLCAGRSRFRVLDILRAESEEAYCRVRAEIIDDLDDEDQSPQGEAAATAEHTDVWRLLTQVLNQTNRLHGTALQLKQSVQQLAPGGAGVPASWEWYTKTAVAGPSAAAASPALRRRLFSLEVAQVLAAAAADLQRLLQTQSTRRRLRMERRLLAEAARMLSARIAIKEAAPQ